MKTMSRLIAISIAAGMLIASCPASAQEAEPAGFDKLFTDALALEEDAKFADALQACEAIEARFTEHPKINDVKELALRLKDEKKKAIELSYAIDKLGSSDPMQVQAAEEAITDEPDAGAVFLRKTVRTAKGKVVAEAIRILDRPLSDEEVRQLATPRGAAPVTAK